LCKVMGLEHLAPFYTMGQEDDKVRSALAEAFRARTRDEWFDILSREDTCVGKVYSLDEIPHDPQVKERGMVVDLDHPTLGKVRQVGVPFKYSGDSLGLPSFASLHGQNTQEVLEGLGYTSQEIQKLQKEGAIK
ncbi:MAG: CoA transferase, partial [Dehalococcoidia bacterium]